MKTKETIKMHIKLTDDDMQLLLNYSKKFQNNISKALNSLIKKVVKLIDDDFNFNIDYEYYLRVLDKVNFDKTKIKRPHIVLDKENHFLMRNIKNRNFRASFALIIRVLIDYVLRKREIYEEGNEDYGPYEFYISIYLTPKIHKISPIPEKFKEKPA